MNNKVNSQLFVFDQLILVSEPAPEIQFYEFAQPTIE